MKVHTLKWIREAMCRLSRELKRRGFTVSLTMVRCLLRAWDCTSRVNHKRLSKQANPNQNKQICSITRQRQAFVKKGAPVTNVNTKLLANLCVLLSLSDLGQRNHSWRFLTPLTYYDFFQL